MTAPKPVTMHAALQYMREAIDNLTKPKHRRLNKTTHTAPSLYMQLRDTITGLHNTGYNGAHQSQPPIWVDAADLLNEIDTAAEIWSPQPQGVPPTVGRLKALANKPPDNVHNVQQITQACQQWAAQITNLLDPEHVKHFRAPDGDGYAPCPQCGKATAYRVDPTDGERKRQPALQWTAETGTTCIVCKAYWDVTHTLWVGKMLGFDMPEGVLE